MEQVIDFVGDSVVNFVAESPTAVTVAVGVATAAVVGKRLFSDKRASSDGATVILRDGSKHAYASAEDAKFVALLARHNFYPVNLMVATIQATGDTALLGYPLEQAEETFHEMSASSSGPKILEETRGDRASYIRAKVLLKGCSYMGLGLEPGEKYVDNATILDRIQSSFSSCWGTCTTCDKASKRAAEVSKKAAAKLNEIDESTGTRASEVAASLVEGVNKIPRGFWDDYRHFLRNNHPILSMCYAHPDHPYDRIERGLTFVLTLSWAFFFAALIAQDDGNFLLRYILVTLFITIPVVIFNTFMYMVLACPCLLHDESESTSTAIYRARDMEKHRIMKGLESCNLLFYVPTVALSILLIAGGIIFYGQTEGKGVVGFFLGLFQSWAASLFLPLLVQFLPYEEYSKKHGPSIARFTGMKVGAWWLEREEVFKIIRERSEGLREGGNEKGFFLPRENDTSDV